MSSRPCANSQDVGDDPDAPEVGGGRDRVVAGDLWRTELRRRVLDVQLAARVVGAREAEVGHFELVRRLAQQQQVLRLYAHTRTHGADTATQRCTGWVETGPRAGNEIGGGVFL